MKNKLLPFLIISSFLKNFIAKQKKTELIQAMKYGLLSGGKKIRSKILLDIGILFTLGYKTLIIMVQLLNVFMLIPLFMMIYHVWIMIK